MKNWSDFIKIFYGVEFIDPISCGNPIGVPKDGTYSLRVYRAILRNNTWCNDTVPITEAYEAMCTPYFNTLLLDQWVQSGINTDGSITYSYYMKIDSCNTLSSSPPLPTL